MRYDPDNVNWIYDSRQFLSADEEHDLIAQQREQQIRNGLKQLHPKNLAASPLQTFLSILALLLFLGLIAGFIVALKTGHPAIGIMMFGALFLIGGLMMAISGKAESEDSAETALGARTVGVLFAMLGLMIIVSMALIPVIGPSRAFIGLAGAGFAWGGLFFSADQSNRCSAHANHTAKLFRHAASAMQEVFTKPKTVLRGCGRMRFLNMNTTANYIRQSIRKALTVMR